MPAPIPNINQPLKKSRDLDFQAKYKTEMCKKWLTDECDFGISCAFAHGKVELRSKLDSQKIKECIHFSETGFCPYGKRCQFKHSMTSKLRLPIFLTICKKGKHELKMTA